ncbi:MAG: serine/threonine-protein kinase, partial [Acidobacteriota bacterium]
MSDPRATEWSVTVIVAEALDLERDERRDFLDSALAAAPAWRSEVESLLAEYDEDDGDFLSIPVARRFDGVESASMPVPERIGRYRILDVLGEGGMGTVYLAEQDEPVRRRVALKVIRRLRRPGIRTRFAAECQALARLKHPNIAAMYEAGVVDHGDGETGSDEDLQPYVAMEWIEGEPMPAWCDARRLDVEARLRLFLGVCAGLHHAHGKGVLHCDLKPSNVLVTEVDGRGVAKVIDFGIARAFDSEPRGDGAAVADEGAELLFCSPLYLSPEAIATGRRLLDVRSEVHSLGLLLYELLVGTLPFEATGSLRDVLRRRSEDEPAAPSRRFGALDAERAEEVATRRNLSPRALERRLRGDLDAVILKAMAKDPAHRYGSVRELASDLERHLGREPVVARQATSAYVAQRFARRHLGPLIAATLLILALLGGLVARTMEARRAQAASVRATAEAERALVANAEAEQVRDFLIDLFRGADVERPGGGLTIQEVLDRAANDLRDDLQDQPLVRARLLQTIGTLYT